MSEPTTLSENTTPLGWMIEKSTRLLPDILLILLIFVVGLVFSFILKRVATKIVDKTGLEALAEKYGIARLLYAIGYKHGFANLSGRVAQIVCLMLTAQVCATKMGLSIVSKLTTALFLFMPDLITACFMIFIGVKIAEWLRDFITNKATEGQASLWAFLAKAAHVVIIGLSTILALSQIGVQTSLLNQMTQIAASTIAFTGAIGFALGAQHTFKQIIAAHYSKVLIKPGDMIIFETLECTLIRHHSLTSVVKDTEGQERTIPASWFVEKAYKIQYLETESA